MTRPRQVVRLVHDHRPAYSGRVNPPVEFEIGEPFTADEARLGRDEKPEPHLPADQTDAGGTKDDPA